jgi:HEPN domain-containing protein
MLGLFKIKRYSDSLFYGNIVLEKILKAHVVKNTKKEAPKTHDLLYLVKLSKLDSALSEEDLDTLDLVNIFNIRARYPDYKFNFYKIYNRFEIAKEKLDITKILYKKLCQKLMPKN